MQEWVGARCLRCHRRMGATELRMRKAVEWAVSTHDPRTVGCPVELTPVGRRRPQCSQLTVDGGMPAHLAGSRSDEDFCCVLNRGVRQEWYATGSPGTAGNRVHSGDILLTFQRRSPDNSQLRALIALSCEESIADASHR